MSEINFYRYFFSLLVASLFMFATIAGCSDSVSSDNNIEEEDNEITTELTLQEAEEIVMTFLDDIGIFSSAYFDRSKSNVLPLPNDYVTTGETDSGNLRVDLWLNSEGIIIPNSEWRSENSNFCSGKNRYMRAPIYLLTIEIHPDTQTVFIRLIDVETSQILKQQEGHSTGEFWVLGAITEAWEKMEGVDHFQAGDPCGGEVNMILEFDSMIESRSMYDGAVTRFVARLVARVPIEATEEAGVLRGIEALVHVKEDYHHPISEVFNNCEYNFTDGKLDAKVTFSEEGFTDIGGITALVGASIIDYIPMAFYSCTDSEGNVTDGNDMQWWLSFTLANQNRVIPEGWYFPGDGYRYGNWNKADDPNVLAIRTVNRTEEHVSDEGAVFEIAEQTTLKLLHAD